MCVCFSVLIFCYMDYFFIICFCLYGDYHIHKPCVFFVSSWSFSHPLFCFSFLPQSQAHTLQHILFLFVLFFLSMLKFSLPISPLHVQMSSFVSTCLSSRRWLPPNGGPMTLFAVISLYCFFITENTCFCRPYTCVSPSVSAPFSCVVLSSRLASPVLLLARHHFFQWTW